MITYVDTSVILKLLLQDETGSDVADRLWTASTFVVCAEIGYAEARAALAAANRASRLTDAAFQIAKTEFESLWAQVAVIAVSPDLVKAAGDLAERHSLRGYDAVHLAAALAGKVTVMASADDRLLDTARAEHISTANPLDP